MTTTSHRKKFIAHQTKNVLIAFMLLAFCLLIGILGYHYTDDIPWVDSIHNASMILSGMGPVVTLQSTAAKLFSSFYAIFSGVMFITNIGILLAPAVKHLFKTFNVDEE